MNDFIVPAVKKIYDKLYPNHRGAIVKDNYFGKKILSEQAGNDLIASKLMKGDPLMVSRLGHVELQCLINYTEIKTLANKNFIKKFIGSVKGEQDKWRDVVRITMERNAGYFPITDDTLEKFALYYFECIKSSDILGVWYNYFEDQVYKQYCPDASLIPLKAIEPYYFNNPWSVMLKGKTVLIIHPFEKSILQQFQLREKLFSNQNILPDFSLKTIKAVQSNAYNKTSFANWFDALDSMKAQMDKIDFDIALIGAGSYGLPLAAYTKLLGKQAIHFGGSLQIFFGIKGSRWDRMPTINKYYNDTWIRPLPEETPENYKSVEDGCYW